VDTEGVGYEDADMINVSQDRARGGGGGGGILRKR
jgi:hypothetical protein